MNLNHFYLPLILISSFFALVIFFYLLIPLLVKKGEKKYDHYRKSLFSKITEGLNTALIEMTPQKVLLIRVIGFVFFILIGFFVTQNLLLTLFFGFLGYYLPKFIIQRIQDKYLEKFEDQLIDALVIISNCLKAGLNLTQAIDLLIKESPDPLSKEFALYKKEIDLGITHEMAFTKMSQRVKSDYLDLFITSIMVARKTGGNLNEILDKISFVIRERNKMQGKIKSLTAQGKMQGVVVGLLPLIILFIISFIDPEFMQPLLNTFIGKCLLVGAGAMLLVGGFWIKKIVTIDV